MSPVILLVETRAIAFHANDQHLRSTDNSFAPFSHRAFRLMERIFDRLAGAGFVFTANPALIFELMRNVIREWQLVRWIFYADIESLGVTDLAEGLDLAISAGPALFKSQAEHICKRGNVL
ncbi:hypothetical protein DOTSEDRAFT_69703 [Dothistroma septosporum NZE10]|uniref:Uncharacterized protein n=1 Tax=Dothistroma septosporum (strain NZE10 / CBS 128990) TaxID=675120 RepID=N1PXY4_DOTSN|nr:hypothetical protein DOTSEDRAFT_69703 [Dothistroma septosporum NZE10]